MRFLVCFAILLLGCSDGASVPENVLSSQKMKDVLYDVVRADEMVDVLKLRDSTYQRFNRRTALYDSVFAIHGITKDDFKKSLDYYESRPDLLKQVLDDMQKKAIDTAGNHYLKKDSRPNISRGQAQ
jgi:hypothetical protein